jgi:hypothetical protein
MAITHVAHVVFSDACFGQSRQMLALSRASKTDTYFTGVRFFSWTRTPNQRKTLDLSDGVFPAFDFSSAEAGW